MADRENNELPGSREERLAGLYDTESSADDLSSEYTLFTRIRDVTDRYSFCDTIAVGGMKTISRVHDCKADRYVAMATLHETAPEEWFEPFLREACLTARLEHPNIISIYNIGINDAGRPFFTMELKVGDSLAGILKKLNEGDAVHRDRYPLEVLLDIFVKVCDAVAYAHSQGVLHLDLKPGNIQVAPFGEVKVCDWGLGCIVDEEGIGEDPLRMHPDLLNSVTAFGKIRGTPGFMAPEQIKGLSRPTDQADVYALGAILFSLLAHVAPFSGSSEQIMSMTLKGTTGAIPHSAPKSLVAAVHKAMALEPEQRYRGVEELCSDIRNYLLGFPTSAEGAGFGRMLMLLYKRNRRICRTIAIGLVLVMAITAWFMVALREREQRERTAKEHAENSFRLYRAEKERAEERQRDHATELLDSSLAASDMLPYVAHRDERAYLEMLYQLNLAIELNPKDTYIRSEKGYILFIQQCFNESSGLLQYAQKYVPLEAVAAKYAAGKVDDELLKPDELAELFRSVKHGSQAFRRTLIEKMAAYDLRRRPDLSDRSIVVEAVLESFNPAWTNRIYEFDAEQRSLTIGGAGLENLKSGDRGTSHQSLLRWLNLHTLELRDTDFSKLGTLRDLPLARLDIRNAESIAGLGALKSFDLLAEVVVAPGQFRESQIKNVPGYITVIELPLAE
ncbi:protein kinase domain-containing protein [Pontiella sulfatireligans]|uniref:Serine/threonine-protein kinase PknD n=1 Tax=Pontiella sulfatireligans TaxID=2750658 RepID=A0A6C2UJ40_9BACT|nr:protein kinase [Pontiella sulfatireligans]VGO19334.1 Serine/threonine-protein kinase PknD [Pontiella sulfatireligans]